MKATITGKVFQSKKMPSGKCVVGLLVPNRYGQREALTVFTDREHPVDTDVEIDIDFYGVDKAQEVVA